MTRGPDGSGGEVPVRAMLRTGAGATLVGLIMVIGSFGLWVGTPLLWLWVGSQVQGVTASLSAGLGTMFIGVLLTVPLMGALLSKLSNSYRENRLSRGFEDPGHVMLEGVLVISAGITLLAFVIWFFFFAGADPVPLGIHL